MNMNNDAKEILEQVDQDKKGDRGRFTFYLSKRAVEEFKKACGEIKPSPVLEKLIKKFSESLSKQKRAA